MYIDIVPNRKSKPAVLLREGWREGKKTLKRTIANLSHWPDEDVEALRLLLKGKKLLPRDEAFAIERSMPHGHVQAVRGGRRGLGGDALLSARPCR